MLQQLKTQPRGLYLLFSTELWERFSYYGMLGLLVLFLVAPAAAGGYGWDNARALRVFGWFLASIWFAPLAGGWLADRVLGARLAVVLGCVGLMLGNLCLAARAFLPELVGASTGTELSSLFSAQGLVLAAAWDRHDVLAAGAAAIELPAAVADAFVLTYRLITIALVGGLSLLVIGAGLFKSNVSVLMGGLYERPDDPRRDFGFTVFYMGINAGALLAPLVAGTAGERIGWHLGFLLSSAGMAVGIAVFLATHRRLLGRAGLRGAVHSRAAVENVAKPEDRRRVIVIGAFACFATVFATGLMMYGGLLNLFTAQQVDRVVSNFEIPATWFLTLNPLYIVLFGPLVASFWDARTRTGRSSSSVEKFTVGLGLMVVAFLIMAGASSVGAHGHSVHGLWIAAFYLIFTVGELCVYPVGLALVSRLAPTHQIGVLMGAWLLTNAVGSWFAGELGALAQSVGSLTIFVTVAAVAAGSAVLLWSRRHRLVALAGITP